MKLSQIIRAKNVEPDDFLKQYMKAGKPIILKDFIEPDSPAFQKWNYEYFKEIAGETKVNVYGSEIESIDRVASKPVGETTFAEYLDLITTKITEHRLFLFNLLSLKPELQDDIHYKDITKGKVLKWLPFMFFGGKGSITRNHIDIDMSHVFLSQFQGVKRVWLFPWEQSDLMYKLPYNFHSLVNLKEPDYEKYPALKGLNGYEAVLYPGETLYIPSGWWHYVQYETEGYSVSVRALPSTALEKWRGFKNLVITRHFDNLMRTLFKDKWFNYKVKIANKRAERAMGNFEDLDFSVEL